ncbi:MAG: phosphatidylinositol mannoside acyltransferase [Actinobacteria bacterium]|nr:phosphatidylinositol mannoside acyltransferase [Actinomycetota bacterium]MDA2961150.1 phosphatidylinositol mannoside acyltransferase [Actinomycetota bacterium]
MSRQLKLFTAGERVLQYVPVVVLEIAVKLVGICTRVVARGARRQAAAHQRRVSPGLRGQLLEQRVDEVFAGYARYWLESVRLPRLSSERVDRSISVHGYEHVAEGLERGNGVILALPHLGGWEWAGRWLADQGVTVYAVAERLADAEVHKYLTDLRAKLGVHVIALDSSAGSKVLTALRNNAVVCLIADRDLQGDGISVKFFGEETTVPGGPATMALRTGAMILPTAVFHSPGKDGHIGLVQPPVAVERTNGSLRDDVKRITQNLTDELAELIRRAPGQWHLLQPNWPSDRR